MIPDFFTRRPDWPERIERVVELLGRIAAIDSGHELELRRTSRVGSVHSSTAIEGNALTLAQVTDIASGAAVYAAALKADGAVRREGPPKKGRWVVVDR